MQQAEYNNNSMMNAQSIFLDEEPPVIDLQEENIEVDQNADKLILDMSSLTFNFGSCTQFEMECPPKEIVIAISKYFCQEFNDLLIEVGANIIINNNKLTITTEKNNDEHEEIKNVLQAYYSQFKSARLYFDYDSQRAIQPSTYILKKCEESSYYLVKIKNIDNQLELYLVTKEINLSIVQDNIQEKFRGIRIFFQDVTNRMTQLRKNANYKSMLTQLRQKYYGKRMVFEISKLFECIEFQDTINTNQTFCSQIFGLNLPFYMTGKVDLAQKIYRYIANLILSLVIVFIKFDPTDENVKQARLLENITNNKKNSQNQFLCASAAFIGNQSIAFLGHPTDLQQLFSELVASKDKFTSEFVSSMSVGILNKNYDYSYEITKGSFSQLEEKLKNKGIIITQEDQFKQMKVTVKSTFGSYCNLIEYLCRTKYSQTIEATERKLQIEYEYIVQRLGGKNNDRKLFDSLDFEYSQFDKDELNKKQYSNTLKQKSSQQEKEQRNQRQPHQNNRINQQNPFMQQEKQDPDQFTRQGRNQNHPRCQQNQQQENGEKEQIIKQSQKQEAVDILFQKSEKSIQDQNQGNHLNQIDESHQQNDRSDSGSQTDDVRLPSLGSNSQFLEDQEQPQEFTEFIIKSVNDTTQKIIVSQEYQKYFKGLLKQNLDQTICLESTNQQLKFGFIPIIKDQFFKLKKIPANLPIFLNEKDCREYCQPLNNQHWLIQVRINEQAEQSQNFLGQQEENVKYFQLSQANQVYPIKKI